MSRPSRLTNLSRTLNPPHALSSRKSKKRMPVMRKKCRQLLCAGKVCLIAQEIDEHNPAMQNDLSKAGDAHTSHGDGLEYDMKAV